jgi:hypothetical protein
MSLDHNQLSHTTWECKYRVVFTPKYRKKVYSGRSGATWALYSTTNARLVSPALVYPTVEEDVEPVVCASCRAFVSTYGQLKERFEECPRHREGGVTAAERQSC